jgi:ABC-2 type transport system ATP-binding protein
MKVAIETKQLTKRYERSASWRSISRYKGTTAVEDVDLTIEEGELFGLLGPNGAGKTTLVKMLCTLIAPSKGTATVAGFPLSDSGSIRSSVGLVVSDERSFYWRLSGKRNLDFFAAMHDLRGSEAEIRIREVLYLVDMSADAEKPFSNYSTGMKQRLAIARSLLHKPKLLFLDEPSRSLDPKATARLHELINQLNVEENTTIFLITHDLAEAESLCQRVAVMNQGQIQVVGEPSNLRRQLRPKQHYAVKVGKLDPGVLVSIRNILPEAAIESTNGHENLLFQAGEEDSILGDLLNCLHENQVTVYGIEGYPPTLEEVFAHFTAQERFEDESSRQKAGADV